MKTTPSTLILPKEQSVPNLPTMQLQPKRPSPLVVQVPLPEQSFGHENSERNKDQIQL